MFTLRLYLANLTAPNTIVNYFQMNCKERKCKKLLITATEKCGYRREVGEMGNLVGEGGDNEIQLHEASITAKKQRKCDTGMGKSGG